MATKSPLTSARLAFLLNSSVETELDIFAAEINRILVAGRDKYNHTFDQLYLTYGPEGLAYTFGEKAVRFSVKQNPDDLLKIATYAYLAWRHHRNETSDK